MFWPKTEFTSTLETQTMSKRTSERLHSLRCSDALEYQQFQSPERSCLEHQVALVGAMVLLATPATLGKPVKVERQYVCT